MSHESHSDPLEFVRNMWGNMGFSLPGMVTPTMDVDELEKRITDMKAVEGWLKMNLNMLQMSIQGLEMQRATLMTIRHMGDAVRRQAEAAPEDIPEEAPNPFAAWSAWMNSQVAPAAESPAEPEAEAEEADSAVDEEAAMKAAADAEAASQAAANAFANAAAAATNAAAAAMWPWQLMAEQDGKAADAPAAKKKAPARRSTAKRASPPKSSPSTTASRTTASKTGSTTKAATSRTRTTAASKKPAAPKKS